MSERRGDERRVGAPTRRAFPPDRRKRHPYDRLRWWQRGLLSIVVSVLLGVALAAIAQHVLPLDEAGKRVLGRSYLPWSTRSYPDVGQSSIAIISIDDTDLNDLRLKWPLDLSFYARLLGRLVHQAEDSERQRPRAVFFDVLFLDARPQREIEAFSVALCDAARVGVPVYLANLPPGLAQSPTMASLLAARYEAFGLERPCATPVAPFTMEDKYDRAGWEYPLFDADNECVGEDRTPLQPAAVAIACGMAESLTTALQDADPLLCARKFPGTPACDPRKREMRQKLALVWPARGSSLNEALLLKESPEGRDPAAKQQYRASCSSRLPWSAYYLPWSMVTPSPSVVSTEPIDAYLLSRASAQLTGLAGRLEDASRIVPLAAPVLSRLQTALETTAGAMGPLPPLCPYTDLLPLRSFYGFGLTPGQLSKHLKGRVIVIAPALLGQLDRSFSPMHGELSGAHMHAMALDNLLSLQHNYQRSEDVDLSRPGSDATRFAVVSVVLVVLAWHLYLAVCHLIQVHAARQSGTTGDLLPPRSDAEMAALAGGKPRGWLHRSGRFMRLTTVALATLGRLPIDRPHRLPTLHTLLQFGCLVVGMATVMFGIFWLATEVFRQGPLAQLEYVLVPLAVGAMGLGPGLARWTALLWAASAEGDAVRFIRETRALPPVQRDPEDYWAEKLTGAAESTAAARRDPGL